MLTETDLQILNAATPETLVRWCCTLNYFGWPEELPDPEPPQYVRGGRRGELIRAIEAAVGSRAILHHVNCVLLGPKSRMSEEEFDDFWRGHFEGDQEALERDELRTRKLCRTSFKILRSILRSKDRDNLAFAKEEIREMRTTGELVKA